MTARVITGGEKPVAFARPHLFPRPYPAEVPDVIRLRAENCDLSSKLALAECQRDEFRRLAVAALAILSGGCVAYIWRALT